MPYLERDRYFSELGDECEKGCEEIAAKILRDHHGK